MINLSLKATNKKPSQCDEILAYLQQGGTLTRLDGLRLFKTMALNSRISDLKREGHRITKTMIKTETGKHVARYRLVKEGELF